MAHYINKDDLVAEIERRKSPFKKEIEDGVYPTYLCALMDIKDFIDTLEVKEADLEKEIDDFIYTYNGRQRLALELDWKQYQVTFEGKKLIDFAKHFFELGLNTQQNIDIDITDIDKVIEENGVDPNSKEAKIFKESYYMALEKIKAQKGE